MLYFSWSSHIQLNALQPIQRECSRMLTYLSVDVVVVVFYLISFPFYVFHFQWKCSSVMDGCCMVRKFPSFEKHIWQTIENTHDGFPSPFWTLAHGRLHRALTSGSGVALALLMGAAGPLIGVAISASLLPPVVNCVSILQIGIIESHSDMNKFS